MTDRNSAAFHNDTYLVSDADFAAFARVLGESHPTANLRFDPMFDYAKNVLIDTDLSFSERYYTVIHSSDPERTATWIASALKDLKNPTKYDEAILTPDAVFDGLIREQASAIVTNLVTLGVLLLLMSLCMYFIMRSSLMSRIKEVGILRAIGVSKRNLLFKFFIEAAVLTVLTIFIGFLITSAFIFACFGASPFASEIFYYPVWLAAADLSLLFAISLFFGTVPVLSLLRKTPSEILSKYDI
jgi:cell division protein FtsX